MTDGGDASNGDQPPSEDADPAKDEAAEADDEDEDDAGETDEADEADEATTGVSAVVIAHKSKKKGGKKLETGLLKEILDAKPGKRYGH
jgi:hypothetical protein